MVYTKANMIKDLTRRIKALELEAAKASASQYHVVIAEILKAKEYLAKLKNTRT
jgi:hypothetical protein